MKLMVEAGAEVNMPCPGNDFLMPLHIAARFNYAAAVRILVSLDGCKLNVEAATPSRCGHGARFL